MSITREIDGRKMRNLEFSIFFLFLKSAFSRAYGFDFDVNSDIDFNAPRESMSRSTFHFACTIVEKRGFEVAAFRIKLDLGET